MHPRSLQARRQQRSMQMKITHSLFFSFPQFNSKPTSSTPLGAARDQQSSRSQIQSHLSPPPLFLSKSTQHVPLGTHTKQPPAQRNRPALPNRFALLRCIACEGGTGEICTYQVWRSTTVGGRAGLVLRGGGRGNCLVSYDLWMWGIYWFGSFFFSFLFLFRIVVAVVE